MRNSIKKIVDSELTDKQKFNKLLDIFRNSQSKNDELRKACNFGYSELRLQKLKNELFVIYTDLKVKPFIDNKQEVKTEELQEIPEKKRNYRKKETKKK